AQDVGWVPGMGRLVTVTFVSVWFGFLLARSPFGGYVSALFATILGAEFVLGFIGRVAPPLGLTLREAVYAGRWLYALAGGAVGRVPFLPVLDVWWERTWDFWVHVSAWVQGIGQGTAQQDNLLFLVFTGLLVWGMGVWAGWWTFRHHRGLVAMLPSGVGLAMNVFFAREGESWTVSFLAASLLLLIGLKRYSLEEVWNRWKLDYSDEIRWGMYFAGVWVSAIIIVFMPLVPTITSRRAADAFWNFFSSPWRHVEKSAERMFPDLEHPAVSPLNVSLGGSPGQMPRLYLLGEPPGLAQRVALRVHLNQPAPQYGGEKRYYRAITYADYSGHGWSNEDQARTSDFPPGQPWDESLASLVGRKRLLQAIELVDAPGGVLYAAGEPIAPDIPYEAHMRGPGDLVSISPKGSVRRYSVLSAVPAVSEEQLRAAGWDYPEEIRSRYLALPDVPQRVLDKAAEVVAGIDNPYDRAVAIENYLRTFEYTLKINPPPPDRDVVDYFLFDLRKGYCDYYASAMVVMARAVGIPARLAVGYASGYYDEHTDEYTVTEADAHSWPELYFPPYGWIPFEPTAARAPFERIGAPDVAMSPPGTGSSQELQELGQWRPWPRRWLAFLKVSVLAFGMAILGYWAWWRYRRRALSSVAIAYSGIVWWGRRLGADRGLAGTPYERAQALSHRLVEITRSAGRQRRRLQRWADAASAEMTGIVDAYVEEVYAARPLPDARRRQAITAWRRLRGKLWAFWFARRL
ncbi:MAG: transglutaminase domain-containing protein, partial [Anaerolineae bacterium]|nr:transglutaminase domain-containing protein [Anaerolineae bacterium]